jgi:hypothetical protein
MLAMTRFDIRGDHPAALGIDEGRNSSHRLFFYLQPCPDSYRDCLLFHQVYNSCNSQSGKVTCAMKAAFKEAVFCNGALRAPGQVW